MIRFRVRPRYLASAATLAAVLAGVSPQSWSQSLEEGEVILPQIVISQEIVVTARKIEETLQEVPVAVNIMDSETIRELDIRSLTDALEMTPGATFYAFSKTEQTYSIRGISSSAEGAAGDSAVLFLEDGEVISRDFMRSSRLYDLDRIEVLRGPQGTTYGRNAVGGLVHAITKSPHHQFEASAGLEAGDNGFFAFDGVVNGEISDTSAGRLSMHHEQRDGYSTNLADGADIDYEENLGLRGQVVFSPSDRLHILLKATYERDDDGAPPRKSYDPTIPYDSPFTEYIEETGDEWTVHNTTGLTLDRTVWSLGTNVQLDMGGVRFTSLTRYRDGDSEEGIDTFGTPDDVVVSFPTNDAQVFAQEFRLDNSSSASDMLWIAGLYYLHEDTYRKEDRDLFTVIDGAPSAVATREVNDEWNKTNSFGVFAEIDYDLLPKTNLALGVRYSRDEKDFSIIHSGTGPLASLVLAENPVIATGLSKTWDAITGRASLTYALTGNSMMYGSVSTGYKAGGFGTQPPTLETAMSAYDEENVVSYEVGAKTEWFGRRLRANIAIFSMAYDDIQTQEFSDSGAVVYTNAGEAETAGIEVDFKAAVTKRFTLSGSFSKLEGEYKTEDLADQNFAEMPDWTANLSGVFVIPLASGALIRCLAHYRGRSRIWHDEVNDPVWGIRDGIGIYSARVSWLSSDDRWELAMWGRNLTDEAEMVNINTQAFMSQRSVGYGAPRTFGLSLSWRYAIADDE